ncbi:ATP-binding cassette domain-containing protein [Cupriavidus agavae]|uniref:ATP-binding cassette subfamily B protein RaxB n=1 Tax=Cupriavidus agavae TaxID=1001822 RepID=A0A4Q7S7J0_9BURK|nr:cysteine peptidase family C39 domain-containing protein [Cupriavidus agavae]RZT42384.1 ATP-binding cassette subfamily B protein RaxB [Cupriavidus agavae]
MLQTIFPHTLRGLHDIEPVYQGETSECGLACLAMLLGSLGIPADLAELRARYGAPQLGMSLADLSEVLAGYGIASDPVRFGRGALAELPLPAILHVGGNHFVLVMRAGGDLFQVYDPAMGEQMLPAGVLAASASGYALILDESVHPHPHAAPRSHALASLVDRAGGTGLIGLTLLVSLLSFVTPLFVGPAVDRMLGADGMAAYLRIGVAFLLATVAAFFFMRLAARLMYLRCAMTGMRALDNGFGLLVENRLRYFSRRFPGEIVERFTAYGFAALDRVRLSNTMLCSVVVSVVAIAAMAWLQPWLAVVSVSGIAVSGLLTQRFKGEEQGLRLESEQAAADQQQFLLETVLGITAWKSALATHRRAADYGDHGLRITDTWRRKANLLIRQETSYMLLGNIELLVMLGVAASAMLAGQLSFGAFYAFVFLRQIAFGAATAGYGAWLAARSNHVANERARDLFEQERDADLPDPAPWHDAIRVEHLVFQHESSPVALSEIELGIRPGEKIALLGASGAGKSTLLTLLSGLDLPDDGVLWIDGAEAPWPALRRHMYLQTSADILFGGSVLDNVTMFAARPDRLAALRLIDDVGLGERIGALPAGIDTVVSEATASLSSGERQRLMVARALYARRSIGLFDEPTANLDGESARQVMAAITAGRQAAVVVTHDRTYLPMFDTVYELADGVLVRVVPAGDGATS